jgi:hypothetical protein
MLWQKEDRRRDKPLEHLYSGQKQCAHKPCKDELLSLIIMIFIEFYMLINDSFSQGKKSANHNQQQKSSVIVMTGYNTTIFWNLIVQLLLCLFWGR